MYTVQGQVFNEQYKENKKLTNMYTVQGIVYSTRRNLLICTLYQGNKARKVNCCCVFSVYILKPFLSEPDI